MISYYYLILFFIFGIFLQKKLNTKNRFKLISFLNKFILYISLPSLIFIHISRLTLDKSLLLPFYTAWGVFLFVAILVILISKIFNWKRDVIVALILTVGLSNSSFLGFPLTISFFGEDGLPTAIVYDQLGSFLILSTLGLFILSLANNEKFRFKNVLIKIITFPSFISLILATILNIDNFPIWSVNILEFLGSMLVILAFIVIGLNLKLTIARDDIWIFTFALLFKLIIIPILLFVLFKELNLNNIVSKVSIFEAAMAPMLTSSLLAILYNIKKDLVSSILSYGIVLSFFTLPLIFAIIS